MPNVFTRSDWGARPPRRAYSYIAHRGRAVIHWSGTKITPAGKGAGTLEALPKKPGAKWYKLWRDPSTPKAQRRKLSRAIRKYNRAMKEYRRLISVSAGANDPKIIALEKAVVRQFQNYHMDAHGWIDGGYNEIIFATGNVYLMRPAGAYGAHTLNANDRMGFCLVMTRGDKPTLAMLDSLNERLDVNNIHHIIGHRQVPGNSTECPGDELIRALHLPTNR